MNAEQLEAWINDKACPLYFHDEENDDGYSGRAIMVSELEKLFAGKVLVPVDKITTVARDVEYSPHTNRHTPFLRISFAYDDYDSRDELAAMLAASQEQVSATAREEPIP
jgi:hypothetical protein